MMENHATAQGVTSSAAGILSKAKQRSRRKTYWEILVTDLWQEPLHASSRTRDRLGHIDFGMVIPPIRALFYCVLCPFLSYPLGLLNIYGFFRCLRTIVLPKYYRRDIYSKRVMYGVQKRVYDAKHKRIHETQVYDVAEMQHAMQVTGEARNQFIDDPEHPGTAYLVIQQRIMRAEAMFTGENWAWAFVSDSCRYLFPVLLAYIFHPTCRRLSIDLWLWSQGRLKWRQLRHPILNFFRSYSEYNRVMNRINITKSAPKGAQLWSKNL